MVKTSNLINCGYCTLTYQLCEIAHPNNCSIGYVTLYLYSGDLFATNDYFDTPIDNAIGGTTSSLVLINLFPMFFES